MTRLLILAGWLLIGGLLAAFVFAVAEDVERQEATLRALEREILKEQRALHILKAEWSYLNQPARLGELAERHLDYAPLPPERLVTFDQLPQRQLAETQPLDPPGEAAQ